MDFRAVDKTAPGAAECAFFKHKTHRTLFPGIEECRFHCRLLKLRKIGNIPFQKPEFTPGAVCSPAGPAVQRDMVFMEFNFPVADFRDRFRIAERICRRFAGKECPPRRRKPDRSAVESAGKGAFRAVEQKGNLFPVDFTLLNQNILLSVTCEDGSGKFIRIICATVPSGKGRFPDWSREALERFRQASVFPLRPHNVPDIPPWLFP